MTVVFLTALLAIVVGAGTLEFFLKFRSLGSFRVNPSAGYDADRYRPMLRLLSDDDIATVRSNPRLLKEVRRNRRRIFRSYLRCLTRDYASLLAALRQAVAASGTDRADLIAAIARNRMLFAWAICKLEIRVAMHASGAATVDLRNLVEAIEILGSQVRAISVLPSAA